MLPSFIGMLQRGLKAVLLLLIPALLMSAQCYTNCTSLSGTPDAMQAHAHCHQHTHPPSDCRHHQTSAFSSPEQTFELTRSATPLQFLTPPLAFVLRAGTAPWYAVALTGTAPPGPSPAQLSSVLRI